MKKIVLPAVLLLLAGLVVLWISKPSPKGEAEGLSPQEGEPSTLSVKTESEPEAGRAAPLLVSESEMPIVGRKPYETGINNDTRVQTTTEGKHRVVEAIQIAETLHSPETSAEDDLDYLEQILSLYRLSFSRNPVAGDNQMVMEALLGSNSRDLVVFPENHPSLNSSGELLDRWGNPYFFHAISGTVMEIFSAGPDGMLNTSDDIQRTDRDGQPLTGADQINDSDAEE